MDYKEKHTFEERSAEAYRIKQSFPGRVPIYIQRAARSENIPQLDKNKFMAPMDITVGQFMFVIRKRLALAAHQALFLFVANTIPITSSLMREVYALHGDADGFLYMMYSGENAFGAPENIISQ